MTTHRLETQSSVVWVFTFTPVRMTRHLAVKRFGTRWTTSFSSRILLDNKWGTSRRSLLYV